MKLTLYLPLLAILLLQLAFTLGAPHPHPHPVLDKAPEHYPEAKGKKGKKFTHWLNGTFGK